MFSSFSRYKTRYDSGQIFPFLIALICVAIIMVMITINVGQLAVFRTDISNAADAGALAGASVMSGHLLSMGLKNDAMCGENLIKTAAIVLAMLIPELGLGIAIAILATMLIKNATYSIQLMTDSYIAWTNAKKTALQYAFNNIGVDEPRPTYEQYLDCLAGPCGDGNRAAATGANYDRYLRVDPDTDAWDHARTGFSRFMEHSKTGFWIDAEFGIAKPSEDPSSGYIINGYGWTRQPNGTFSNSYDDQGVGCHSTYCWQTYENFVEVIVEADTMYSTDEFEEVKLPGQSALEKAVWIYIFVTSFLKFFAIFMFLGPLLSALVAGVLARAVANLAKNLMKLIHFGIKFRNQGESVDNNTIDVTTRRYKAGENAGLWEFTYGSEPALAMQAYAKASPSSAGGKTVEPHIWGSLWAVVLLFMNPVIQVIGIAYIWTHLDELFDTSKHLFEVEIREIDWQPNPP
ncbi:pilus assembly protein TadG-related protein [Candidatus Omnitrophota bacterium]